MDSKTQLGAKQRTEATSKATPVRRWDAIDEASWQSFPASDAPSAWAGKDRQPDEEEEEQRPETD